MFQVTNLINIIIVIAAALMQRFYIFDFVAAAWRRAPACLTSRFSNETNPYAFQTEKRNENRNMHQTTSIHHIQRPIYRSLAYLSSQLQ